MTDDELNKFRAVVKEEIVATEQRFRVILKDELILSEKRVLNEIGEFVDSQLLPIIDEKADKTDIDRIERRLDYFLDKVPEHDKRLADIESLPSIAHELKRRKKRRGDISASPLKKT